MESRFALDETIIDAFDDLADGCLLHAVAIDIDGTTLAHQCFVYEISNVVEAYQAEAAESPEIFDFFFGARNENTPTNGEN